MALIRCKGCGNMVSSRATSCPKCGFSVHLSMEQQEEVNQPVTQPAASNTAEQQEEENPQVTPAPASNTVEQQKEENQPVTLPFDEESGGSSKKVTLSLWLIAIILLGITGLGLYDSNQKAVRNSGYTETSRESVSEKPRTDEQTSVQPIAGVYTVTDKIDNTWTLTLNEDGSGNMRKDEAVAYCSWKDYRDMDYGIIISFSQRSPKLWFPISVVSQIHFCMADGYLYVNANVYKAKNPEQRLPITKVK